MYLFLKTLKNSIVSIIERYINEDITEGYRLTKPVESAQVMSITTSSFMSSSKKFQENAATMNTQTDAQANYILV